MNAIEISALFNEHIDVWKSWQSENGKIYWTDKCGLNHSCDTIKELKKWLENHTRQS